MTSDVAENAMCDACGHDVAAHYDPGCVAPGVASGACKCIAAWRDEPLGQPSFRESPRSAPLHSVTKPWFTIECQACGVKALVGRNNLAPGLDVMWLGAISDRDLIQVWKFPLPERSL